MKKIYLPILFLSWFFIFINSAGAVVKKYQGKGELYFTDKLIDEYLNYVNKPLSKLPLVFFISEDKQNFYSVVINNDGGGYAGSSTIQKKKIKCERKLNQKCDLFSNVRYIVWDNGKNPFNKDVSKINPKISKEELIIKLTKLGFIINEEQLAIKKDKAAKKKAKNEKALKEKAAKKKKLAEEKVAKKKAAKEKKIAEEKVAKEKKLAEENAAKNKIEKKLSLIPAETDLKNAQNFLINLQDFIKDYPDEFDIVKVSEFFILTKPILDGNLSFKLKEDLKLFKEFTNSSEKFVKYNEDIEKNRRKEILQKIDQAYIDLEASIKTIKGFMIENPNSLNLKTWLADIKIANDALDNPDSYDQLLSINNKLNNLINEKNELDAATLELKYTIDKLKDHLKENLTTDLAPLIIEQIKLSEETIKNEITKNIISANRTAKDFIFKKIEEPKKLAEEKAAKEKQLAEEKAAKEKKLAEEKARKEYLKTPEGQKEEKERIKKEKERLAEEKRLKNFKPISMTCTYMGQGGIKTYKWVFDGKNINWQGMELKVGEKIDDGMGTTISAKKLEGRDNFELDIVAGFVPLSVKVNFAERSSVMDTLGIKVYGTCI